MRKRAALTVKPLPVVTSRVHEGFKKRRLLLLHPFLGGEEDTCEAAGRLSLTEEEKTRLR